MQCFFLFFATHYLYYRCNSDVFYFFTTRERKRVSFFSFLFTQVEVTFASNNNNFIDIINGIFIFHALFKSINKNKTFICRQIDWLILIIYIFKTFTSNTNSLMKNNKYITKQIDKVWEKRKWGMFLIYSNE